MLVVVTVALSPSPAAWTHNLLGRGAAGICLPSSVLLRVSAFGREEGWEGRREGVNFQLFSGHE